MRARHERWHAGRRAGHRPYADETGASTVPPIRAGPSQLWTWARGCVRVCVRGRGEGGRTVLEATKYTKKNVRNANRNERSQGRSLLHGQDRGTTQDHRNGIEQRLAVGGWRRLAAVGGWRRLAAVGGWRRLAAVGGWRRLAAVGGPWGLSLKKKSGFLRTAPATGGGGHQG